MTCHNVVTCFCKPSTCPCKWFDTRRRADATNPASHNPVAVNPEQQQDQVKPDQSYNLIWRILINCRPSHSSNRPACCSRSLSFQPAHQQPAATVDSPSNRPSPLATIKTYPATPPQPPSTCPATPCNNFGNILPPLALPSKCSATLRPTSQTYPAVACPPRKRRATSQPTSHMSSHLAPHLTKTKPPLQPPHKPPEKSPYRVKLNYRV